MDGILDAAKELFGYNREGFMFDNELRLKREYQEQDMRVKQFVLYREDVRDLTELTTAKMDSYLLVALLELGCCFDLLVHGILYFVWGDQGSHTGQPTWLLWLYVVSLAEAFLYLFLSAWFAIHASVAAHSFAVRLLTQFVRLPVPDRSKLDAARAYAAEFEGSASQLLRVPVLSRQLDNITRDADDQDSASTQGSPAEDIGVALATLNESHTSNVTSLKHVKLYRDLQSNWQAHDAYARACLALGTYTLVHAIAYYAIGYFVVQLHVVWPAFACSLILPTLAWLLIRLDLYFGSYCTVLSALLLMLGPVLAWVATTLAVLPPVWLEALHRTHIVLVPVNFLLHVALIVAIACVASADNSGGAGVALPTRFRTVLYLDVFGWVTDPEARQVQERAERMGARQARRSRQDNRSQPLPPPLNAALRTECQLFSSYLQLELQAWEGQGASESIKAMPALASEVGELRRTLDRLKALARVDLSTASGALPDLWLRLAPEDSVVYYVGAETGEVRREPPEGARVSDLSGVRLRLAALRERCEMLQASGALVPAAELDATGTGATGSGAASSGAAGSGAASSGAAGSGAASSAAAGSGAASSGAAGSGDAQAHVTTWPLVGGLSVASSAGSGAVGNLGSHMGASASVGVIEEEATSAQETRFGGREAAQVEWLGGGYGHSPYAAQTFHPRQDGRRESRRPPGQVPWVTFLSASVCVGSVWMAGVGSCVVSPLSALGRELATGVREEVPWMSARLIVGAGAWASQLLPPKPVALACHESYGPVAFLVERFAVHEVPLTEDGAELGPPAAQSRAAHACLAHAPAFHAAGFSGARLDCSRPGRCDLLLLGPGGRRALRCPLRGEAAGRRAAEASTTAAALDSSSPPTLVGLGRDRGTTTPLPHALEAPPGRSWAGACALGRRRFAAAEEGPEVWGLGEESLVQPSLLIQ